MSTSLYSGFYPSCPIWFGRCPDFDTSDLNIRFTNIMSEDVYVEKKEDYTIRFQKDGMILINIPKVEGRKNKDDIDELVSLWSSYLQYLNAIYLLLDSALLEIDKISYFYMHELTRRDAFRVTYENDRNIGENIAQDSYASSYQMGRFLSSYQKYVPLKMDARILRRREVSIDVVKYICRQFSYSFSRNDLIRSLSSFCKALSEFKVGDYNTCIILSWFIIEESLFQFWNSWLSEKSYMSGFSRIGNKRRDFLNGRDFTSSIVSNILELSDIIDYELFKHIDSVRKNRNKVVHNLEHVTSVSDAISALQAAQSIMQIRWDFYFSPNYSYSVAGP